MTMHLNGRLDEQITPVVAAAGLLLTSTLGDTKYFSMKGHRRCMIVISIADGTTVTGSTITLKQATAVAGTAEKALAFTRMLSSVDYPTAALAETAVTSNTFTTQTTNSKDSVYVIDVGSEDLDDPAVDPLDNVLGARRQHVGGQEANAGGDGRIAAGRQRNAAVGLQQLDHEPRQDGRCAATPYFPIRYPVGHGRRSFMAWLIPAQSVRSRVQPGSTATRSVRAIAQTTVTPIARLMPRSPPCRAQWPAAAEPCGLRRPASGSR